MTGSPLSRSSQPRVVWFVAFFVPPSLVGPQQTCRPRIRISQLPLRTRPIPSGTQDPELAEPNDIRPSLLRLSLCHLRFPVCDRKVVETGRTPLAQCQIQLVRIHHANKPLHGRLTDTVVPLAAKQIESLSMPSIRSKRSPRPGPPGRRPPTACASMASTSRPWKATWTA